MRAIRKDFLREIRNTRSRFLSILILVALAVAFFSGLKSTAPDMKRTCDEYLDQQAFMDIQVLSTLGLTQEDLTTLRQQPGVADGEGAYVIDAFAHTKELDIVAKVYSMPQRLNQLTLTEGRMPEETWECVVDDVLLDRLNLEIGDRVELLTSGSYEDALGTDSFLIVGTVVSPLYISVQRGTSTLGTGQVAAYVYLPREAFQMDYYTAIYLTADGAAEETAFYEDYDAVVDGLAEGLEPLGEERAKLRRDSLVQEANEKLQDAQAELDQAKADVEKELSDAWNKLQDAKQELDTARKELDDGWGELREAKEKLAKETADAQKEIANGKQTLADAKRELEDGEKAYSSGLDQYQEGRKEYEAALAQYEENRQKVEAGWKDYEAGLQEYQAGQESLAASYNQLQQGEAEYQSGKEQFDSFASGYLLAGTGYGSSDALGQALVAEGGAGPVHASVNGVLSDLKNQIAALETTVATLDQLESAQDQLTSGIAEAEGQIQQLDSAIAGVKAQIAQLEAGGGAQPAPDPAEDGEAEPGTEGNANAATLAALEQQLSQLETQRQTAQGTLAALEQQLEQTNSGLAQMDAALAQQNMTRASARETLAQLKAASSQLPADASQVEASYRQLTAARAQLDEGWSQYTSGQAQLAEAKKELDQAKAQLEEGEQQLNEGKEELDKGQAELAATEQKLLEARKELDDGWAEYEKGAKDLIDAEDELSTQVAKAQAQIADGEAELRSGESQYASGLAEYQDGLREYNEGKAESEEKIADAEQELADARREIADIDDCEWYILTRDSNPGYLGFGQDADRMGNLADLFPVLFFMVAALVCLTTMTRMVEEQRMQIGTMKALGYTRWSIAGKYLGYGLLPSLVGGIVGLALGFTLFPKMIFTAYQIMYDVPDIHLFVYPDISTVSLLAAVACTTVATLAACLATLADTPASLMRPRAPKAGKRVLLEYIRPLWRRMSFNHKVTTRNLLRYQKRFWMTVIGIGGCTALIIAGFGLRSSLLTTMSVQYDDLYHYTAQLAVNDNLLESEREVIEEHIAGNPDITASLPCRLGSVTAESDTYSTTVYLEVVDPAEIGDFVELRTMGDREPLTIPDDGVIIDQKLSELLDVGPGDTFTVDGDSRAELRIAAVTEHYLAHFIYASPAYYEKAFGEDYQSNAYLLSFTSSDEALCDEVFTDLMDLNGVVSATRMLNTKDTYLSSMERIDFVVVIVILSAAALAMVVLYNLSNINITERIRELATIRVLGFYDREVSAYVNRENVVLTIVGIALGILGGHFLHVWLVKSVEIDLMMFGRETDPMAYLWSALLTAAFSGAVSLIAHRKMKKIDMVESLKSAE